MSVEPAIRGSIGASVIYVIRRAAIARLALPAPLLAEFEYLVETNRHFRSRSCYDNHKNPQQIGSGRTYVNRRNVVNAVP